MTLAPRAESSTLLDPDSYVRLGALEWEPQRFTDLGGAVALVTPLWLHGEPVGGLVLHVTGTAAAVAYAESCLIASTGKEAS